MPTSVKFIETLNLIEVRHAGETRVEDFYAGYNEVLRIVGANGPLNALIDLREVKLEMSPFDIVGFAKNVRVPDTAKAALIIDRENHDAVFFETVMRNHGAGIKSFWDYQQALNYVKP